MVEPIDVGHGELDVIESTPWSLPVDQLPTVEPVERLGQAFTATSDDRLHRPADLVAREFKPIMSGAMQRHPAAIRPGIVLRYRKLHVGSPRNSDIAPFAAWPSST